MQVGDKVKIMYGVYNGLIGEIHSIATNKFGEDLLYIVKIPTNELVKVFADSVELVRDENPDTITIDRNDFRKVVSTVLAKIIKEDGVDPKIIPVLTLNGILIGSRLEKELFND